MVRSILKFRSVVLKIVINAHLIQRIGGLIFFLFVYILYMFLKYKFYSYSDAVVLGIHSSVTNIVGAIVWLQKDKVDTFLISVDYERFVNKLLRRKMQRLVFGFSGARCILS